MSNNEQEEEGDADGEHPSTREELQQTPADEAQQTSADGLFSTAVDEWTLDAARHRLVQDAEVDTRNELTRTMTDKLRNLLVPANLVLISVFLDMVFACGILFDMVFTCRILLDMVFTYGMQLVLLYIYL